MFAKRFLSTVRNSYVRFLRYFLISFLKFCTRVLEKSIDDDDLPIAPDRKEDRSNDAQLKPDESTARQLRSTDNFEIPSRPNPGQVNDGSSRLNRGPAVENRKKRKTVKSSGYIAPGVQTERRITKILDGMKHENLRKTSEEVWSIAKQESLRWFANYLITKRVGRKDPYIQTMYIGLVKNIDNRFFIDLTTNETVKNIEMFGPSDPWLTYVAEVVLEIRKQPDLSLLFYKAEVENLYTKLLEKRAERR